MLAKLVCSVVWFPSSCLVFKSQWKGNPDLNWNIQQNLPAAKHPSGLVSTSKSRDLFWNDDRVNIVKAILSENSKTLKLGWREHMSEFISLLTIRNFLFNVEGTFTLATSNWPAKQAVVMSESRMWVFSSWKQCCSVNRCFRPVLI